MKADVRNFIKFTLEALYPASLTSKIFDSSFLIRYLDKKTRSVDRSSKSRASFANIYAIYVLIQDYLNVIATKGKYKKYKGMRFSDALKQVRSLPWGEKLQNHALNSRLNEEFRKFFGSETKQLPVLRDLITRRYWVNENLLLVRINGEEINVADTIIKIIDRYIFLKQEGYTKFINTCTKLQKKFDSTKAYEFLNSILSEDTDARLFEVLSYCVLKQVYKNKNLALYRTGRTNANDGGIDFVLKPEGRFFQVTEVFNFEKYFLDIEKLMHFPITFVIRTGLSPEESLKRIKQDAEGKYNRETVQKYLSCFEEVITLPTMMAFLKRIKEKNQIKELLSELILQYQIEYNIKNP